MAKVRISGLHKRFGGVHAVRGIDLDIPDGEFTVLVGPSGCGKSTLLRTIAGLEEIDDGTIEIDNEVVNDMRPRDRDVAMVFQDYALYPHMTAFGNIGLSLRARGMPKAEIETRVRRTAEMLGIAALLERYPRQLSGGQRQRVAIGRAIVRNPRVFLFDEPLSNLDAQLREEMRGEIKRLHQDIATTGAPLDLFEQPASLFVAGFLGSPQMNFLRGTLVRDGAATAVRLGDGSVALKLPPGRGVGAVTNDASVILGLRPEHAGRARSDQPSNGAARVEATIEPLQPTGSRTYATFRLAGQATMAELQAHDVSRPGEQIAIDINLRRASLFDADSGRAF